MPAVKQLFNDFTLGQIDKVNPENIPDQALQRAFNVDVDSGSVGTRLGIRRINTGLNVNTHPSAFDNAAWTKINTTITANAKANPSNGAVDADKLASTAGTGNLTLGSKFGLFDITDVWTGSVWVRTPIEVEPVSGKYPLFVLGIAFYEGVTQREKATFQFGLHPSATIPHTLLFTVGTISEGGIGATIIAADGAVWYKLWLTAKASGGWPLVDLVNMDINVSLAELLQDPLDPSSTITASASFDGWHYCWNGHLSPGRELIEDHLDEHDSAIWDPVTPTTDLMQQLGDGTSIFEYQKTDGTKEIIATFERADPTIIDDDPAAYQEIHVFDAATDLFDIVTPTTPASEATGNGHRWQWVNFNDLAIGVNRIPASETPVSGFTLFNPVKKTALGDAAGNVAALGGTPPRGRYIEVFKSRVWIVDEDNPDTLVCSALNLEEDWTATGIAGSQSFQFYDTGGSEIKGIKAGKTPDGRDVLFVFLRAAVYYMLPGAPDVDIAQYQIKLLSSATGCVSAYTIAEILDDTVFLSPYGVLPISALFTSKDLENSSLSKNLIDFDDINVNTENHVAVVDIRNSKYIISISTGISTVPNKCYVLDFSRTKDGILAAFEYGGAWIASSYGLVSDPATGRKRIGISGFADHLANDVAAFYLGNELNRYHDSFVPIDTIVITKRFNVPGLVGLLDFKRIYAIFNLLTTTVSPTISIRFDGDPSNFENYEATFSGSLAAGGIWGIGIWNTSTWAVKVDTIKRWQKKLVSTLTNNLITRARSIEITITTSEEISGYVLQALGFKANELGDYRW